MQKIIHCKKILVSFFDNLITVCFASLIQVPKAIKNCKDDTMKESLSKSLEAYTSNTVPAAE